MKAEPLPPESPHLSVRPDPARPLDLSFGLEQRHTRLGGALGASMLAHAAVVVLAIFIGYLLPDDVIDGVLHERPSLEIVWLALPGPGGGGGGGGNEMPEPPVPVELPGEAPMTVPVEAAPEPTPEPHPDPDPPPLQIDIPAQTMAASTAMAPGVIESSGASSSLGPGSGTGAGDGDGDGIGPGQGAGLGDGTGGGSGGGLHRPGSGVTDPVPLRRVRPEYTIDAMRAKVQGEVWVQCVVRPDGTCSDLRVVRSLDTRFGLDDEALKAASQWLFSPGTLGGEPVAVQVVIQIDFVLR